MIPYVIILSLCVAVCYAGDPKIMAACAQELSVSNADELLQSFIKTGQFADESDTKSKCWFHCLAKKENAIDDAGNINVSSMKAMMAPKYASKMSADEVCALMDKCAARSETDPCEKVYEFHKCHMKEFLAKQ